MMNDQQAGRVLDALGNQVRREILTMLRERPLPVGAIADRLPVSRPAVSKHLRILEHAGLVMCRTSGTRNIFHLNARGFQDVRLYLELFWDEALLNFQRVAEAQSDA